MTKTTRASVASMILGAALVASPASGQDALFVGTGIPPGEAALLRAAIGDALGGRVLTTDELRAALTRRASELGPDPSGQAGNAALERAHRAYVELRLGESASAYSEALEALTGSDQVVAEPASVARVLFERSLVHLAAQRRSDAARDLAAALSIDGTLTPDRDVYGAPILELFDAARRDPGSEHQLVVEVEPPDARVEVDGVVVAPGTAVTVRGEGPHLVTAASPGFAPASRLTRLRQRHGSVALRLSDGSPELVAAQAIEAWPEGPLDEAVRPFAAGAAGLQRIVAARVADRQIELVLTTLEGEVVRRTAGQRESWEPRPFHVLAEHLAGRTVEQPAGGATLGVSLAVAAPREVTLGDAIPLEVTLRDPVGIAQRLVARCGEATLQAPADAGSSTLPLLAATALGEVRCSVSAIDGAQNPLARSPDAEAGLRVRVVEPPSDDTGWWVLGSALTAGVAVAATVLGILLYQPEQRLVIEGLDP